MNVLFKKESSSVVVFHGIYQELQMMFHCFVIFMEIIVLIMLCNLFHLMIVTALLIVLEHISVFLSPASQWTIQV
jgi:hypothetical protein